MEVDASANANAEETRPHAQLEVHQKMFDLLVGRCYLVGRARLYDRLPKGRVLEMNSLSVDFKHALIIVGEESAKIIDLATVEGTFVNSVRIETVTCLDVKLHEKNTVRFGDFEGILQFYNNNNRNNSTCQSPPQQSQMDSDKSSGFDEQAEKNISNLVASSPISDKSAKMASEPDPNAVLAAAPPTADELPTIFGNIASAADGGDGDGESFIIPDTQVCQLPAAPFDSKDSSTAESSYKEGDDFCIPETQETPDVGLLAEISTDVNETQLTQSIFDVNEDQPMGTLSGDLLDGENSEFRVCTQIFNADFDNNTSNVLLESIQMAQMMPDGNNDAAATPENDFQLLPTVQQLTLPDQNELDAEKPDDSASGKRTEDQQNFDDVLESMRLQINTQQATLEVDVTGTAAPANETAAVDDSMEMSALNWSSQTPRSADLNESKIIDADIDVDVVVGEVMNVADINVHVTIAAEQLDMAPTDTFDLVDFVNENNADQVNSPIVALPASAPTVSAAAENLSPNEPVTNINEDLVLTQIFQPVALPATLSDKGNSDTPNVSSKSPGKLARELEEHRNIVDDDDDVLGVTQIFDLRHQAPIQTEPTAEIRADESENHAGVENGEMAKGSKSGTEEALEADAVGERKLKSASKKKDLDDFIHTPLLIKEAFMPLSDEAAVEPQCDKNEKVGTSEENIHLPVLINEENKDDFESLVPEEMRIKKTTAADVPDEPVQVPCYNIAFGDGSPAETTKVEGRARRQASKYKSYAEEASSPMTVGGKRGKRKRRGSSPKHETKMSVPQINEEKKGPVAKKRRATRSTRNCDEEIAATSKNGSADKHATKRRSSATPKEDVQEPKHLKQMEDDEKPSTSRAALFKRQAKKPVEHQISQRKQPPRRATKEKCFLYAESSTDTEEELNYIRAKKLKTKKIASPKKTTAVMKGGTKDVKCEEEKVIVESDGKVEMNVDKKNTKMKTIKTEVQTEAVAIQDKGDNLKSAKADESAVGVAMEHHPEPGSSTTAGSDESPVVMAKKVGRPKQQKNAETEGSVNTLDKSTSSGRIKVVGTMVDRTKLKELAGKKNELWSVINDPTKCDILVMEKAKRTYKFLVAMARGIPIVTTEWLKELNDGKIVPADGKHFFCDASFENQFGFSIMGSLERALNAKVLKDLNFVITPNTEPSKDELSTILKCAGGRVFSKMPVNRRGRIIYLVTNYTDTSQLSRYCRGNDNVKIVKTEGILSAVMRQKIEALEEHIIEYIEP